MVFTNFWGNDPQPKQPENDNANSGPYRWDEPFTESEIRAALSTYLSLGISGQESATGSMERALRTALELRHLRITESEQK